MLKLIQAVNYNYLDDADRTVPPALTAAQTRFDHDWPRICLTEVKSWDASDEDLAKYNMISGKATALARIKKIKQDLNPNLIFLRHLSPRAYQGYNEPAYGQAASMPFVTTGPITRHVPGSVASMFAGHWLYQAGTTATEAIEAGETSITVADAGKLGIGQYAVIYDAPAGSFANAEHVQVTARSGNTITVSRGFKSVATSHPNGAIIAQHILGAGEENQLWAYNQSSTCPKDNNGMGETLGYRMAAWLAANINRDQRGIVVDVEIEGVLNDSDKWEYPTQSGDCDNDLIDDKGIVGGVNVWGAGMEFYHNRLHTLIPGKWIVGGGAQTHGFDALAGTQMEEWPTLFRGTREAKFDSALADLAFNVHRRIYPAGTHCLVRDQTKTYWDRQGVCPADNRLFRFAFGANLLDNGYFGLENNKDYYPDPWLDEYAVNVTCPRTSADFGRAVAVSDPTIRNHVGWMGRPTDRWRRLYDAKTFALQNSVIGQVGFEKSIDGWSAFHSAISKDSTRGKSPDGLSSLKISGISSGAYVSGPEVQLLGNTLYTIVFLARAEAPRVITVRLGAVSQDLFVAGGWQRKVITAKTMSAGKYRLKFYVGDEAPDVWLDSVLMFPGTSNVFARQFTHAQVLVNATSEAKGIALGGEYKRIIGNQDCQVNNGARVSEVLIQPWDAAILIRL